MTETIPLLRLATLASPTLEVHVLEELMKTRRRRPDADTDQLIA